MADLAKGIYDGNMCRFEIAFDRAFTFEHMDERLNHQNAEFRQSRSRSVAGAQRLLGNGGT
jgi:hypothetical protein